MKRRLAFVAAVMALSAVSGTASAGDATLVSVSTFTGMCEPSAVLAIPPGSVDGHVLVGNDEDNVLRLYDLSNDGSGPSTIDVNQALGLQASDDDDDVDIEGAAWLGDEGLFIGSLGRSKKGHMRPARSTLFGVAVTEIEPLAIIARRYASFDVLLTALGELSSDLQAAIQLEVPDSKPLNPKGSGINLEGLAANGKGELVLGFRNPLVGPDKRAVVATLAKAAEFLAGKVPELTLETPMDLGGRGVRDLVFVPATNDFLVIAGPVAGGSNFTLFRWDGANAPTEVPGAKALIAALNDFSPEAAIVSTEAKMIRLFSDEGNECSGPAFRSALVSFDWKAMSAN